MLISCVNFLKLKKVKHVYTEGCVCTSLLVNGVETSDLSVEELKEALIELIQNEMDSGNLQKYWTTILEYSGKYEDLGHCDQCGDYISRYTINIE